MRLDKFLKISRIIKRRSITKEVAGKGRIQVNGKSVKSPSDVKVGDILKVQFGNKTLEVKIMELHESTRKEDAQKMYGVISENRTETLEKQTRQAFATLA